MNRERLKILADFLRTVDRKHFDLKRWVTGVKVSDSMPPDLNACGSTGCAIGWATTIPEFREAGLTLYNPFSVYPQPRYGTWVGFPAVKTFFDININMASCLFHDEQYSSSDRFNPMAVVRRIDALLARGSIDKYFCMEEIDKPGVYE